MFIIEAAPAAVKPAAVKPAAIAHSTPGRFSAWGEQTISEWTDADRAEYEAWLDTLEGQANIEARAGEAAFADRYDAGELPF